MSDNSEQQSIANDLVTALIKEKRSEKRWKNIRFFLGLGIIVAILGLMSSGGSLISLGGPHEQKGYVAFVKLEGMIEPGRDFSGEVAVPRLRDAFADTDAKGLVIDINSGGGTPVQAAIIHDAILELKKKYHKKVIVVGEDMLASGAYYVAVAGDKIYVNPNTLTGSIGVIMKGFGFPDVLKKVGVERRVYASGINKDRLDPFLPQNPEDVEKIRTVIGEIHNNFNKVVSEGRAGKLHAAPEELFTGDFWSGTTALKLGLVDELGNLSDALHKEFNVSRYRDYSASQGVFKSALSQFGMTMNAVLNNDEVRVLEKL
jgi:protease-4